MNPDIDRLRGYPFERLAALVPGDTPPPGSTPIRLSIGEPRHTPPAFVLDALARAIPAGMGIYPPTRGIDSLRDAIGAWADRRWGLAPGSLDRSRGIVPVNGTREAIHALAIATVDRARARGGPPLVVMPNPYYQIYEGGALMAGARPYFVPCRRERGFLPDWDAVPESVWRRCQLAFLCTPGNPTGAVETVDSLARMIERADRYGFVLASDECYGEVYLDEAAPPPGLLQVCARLGRADLARCVVFQSLSKRSNVPGLRSGFVAGDARVIEPYVRYRTYHGSAMPHHVQVASEAAWRDEAHVVQSRALYREKFDACLPILAPVLDVARPGGGFFCWAGVPTGDAERFARTLFARSNVLVLPGTYLSQVTDGEDPAAGRVRIALVEPAATCTDAARRIERVARDLASGRSAGAST